MKSGYFLTLLTGIFFGYYVNFSLDSGYHANQIENKFQLLKEKLININNTLRVLSENNRTNDKTMKLDSSNVEKITLTELKILLEEITQEQPHEINQQANNVVDDSSAHWELISQIQGQIYSGVTISSDFLNSDEMQKI